SGESDDGMVIQNGNNLKFIADHRARRRRRQNIYRDIAGAATITTGRRGWNQLFGNLAFDTDATIVHLLAGCGGSSFIPGARRRRNIARAGCIAVSFLGSWEREKPAQN